MLGKLLKNEIKATSRLFLPIYLAVLLFGFINRFMNPFDVANASSSFTVQAVLRTFSMLLYIGLIIGALVMTFVIMIQRFYKNLLGDEGYLMFTLPVKAWQHIVSKLLVSMLWFTLSFLTVISSVLIIANVPNLFGEIAKIIDAIKSYLGTGGLLLIPLYFIIAMFYAIVTIYDSMAIGHLFSKHRVLASFGAYIGLYIISQIVSSVAVLIFASSNAGIFAQNAVPSPAQVTTFIVSLLSLFTLLAAGNFILANTILKKKLNLE